jgi:menaquinone-dependent protoporphyrinogen oxidase
MRILVAVASKHGSTKGIAQAIVDELDAMGAETELKEVDESPDVGQYGAVIIGSAVYMGNWLSEARRFVEENQAKLKELPVWLFSSGPLGEHDPQPKDSPAHLSEIMQATGAKGHQIFVGKLDKSELGLGERLTVKMVRAPYGDFRDWEAIRAWARDIGNELKIANAAATGDALDPPAPGT